MVIDGFAVVSPLEECDHQSVKSIATAIAITMRSEIAATNVQERWLKGKQVEMHLPLIGVLSRTNLADLNLACIVLYSLPAGYN